jgi:branched-chain amino acid transport system substrate-binding protein
VKKKTLASTCLGMIPITIADFDGLMTIKMKKTIIIFILLATNVIGLIIFLPNAFFKVKKDAIYIAIAGPMSGKSRENGEEMVEGVRLCLEKLKKKPGLINNKKIELINYDDNGKQSARKIGSTIADEGKVLLVLGHYDSACSIAAGSIYNKNGIPAITASSTDKAVTIDNDWYFSIVPDQNSMANFMPFVVKELFGSESISVIYEESKYGRDMAKIFEKEIKNHDIKLMKKWGYDSGDENKEHDMKNIIGQLRAAEDPGVIYSITCAMEGVKFISSFCFPGTNYNIIGPFSFSTSSFIEHFVDYPKEKESPGYYTDGIRAASPFISYLGDSKEAREFRKAFVERKKREPSWIAACYYDAMLVAASAIERAEIKGDDIREDRNRIRKALASFNEKDVAINGITGHLFFDRDGDINIPLSVGEWRKHMFVPTYDQYYRAGTGTTEKKKGEEVTKVGGKRYKLFSVVYAGCYVNEIRNIVETENGAFDADFYLWFRFKGDFDDSNIVFTNTIGPLKLDVPVMNDTKEGITVRAYRVMGKFKSSFDKTLLPKDKHSLRISFRHKEITREKMMYVPDVVGLPPKPSRSYESEDILKNAHFWESDDVSFEGNIWKLEGTIGNIIDYSQFSTEIVIKRKGKFYLLMKNIFPIIAVIIFLYFIFRNTLNFR